MSLAAKLVAIVCLLAAWAVLDLLKEDNDE